MELHHLRHFVCVAEELSFGHAAARLGIDQPAVSRSIKRLEELLGVTLFERNRRHVALTRAGRVLLEEAREVLARVKLAERLTKEAASCEANHLTVSFIPAALFHLLPRVLSHFREKHPEIEVSLEERFAPQQIEGLREGKFDIAFVNLPLADQRGLSVRVVEQARFVVAVPSTWPLARATSLRIRQLADYPFIMHPQSISPEAYASFRSACQEAGFVPRVIQEAQQTHGVLSLVSGGIGVGFVVETARSIAGDNVTLIPLDDRPSYFYRELGAVWLSRAQLSRPLREFLKSLVGAPAGAGQVKTGQMVKEPSY